MRLINADNLIAELGLSECHNCHFGGDYCVDCKQIDAHKVLNEIINQPTSYDVEKVVGEIKSWSPNHFDMNDVLQIDKSEAINIVERGGAYD